MNRLELRADGLFPTEDGPALARLEELVGDRLRQVHTRIREERMSGRLPMLELPDRGELVEVIRGFADGVGQAFENVVVLAAGGSLPGTRALLAALLPPWWNELGADQRDYYPRVYTLDNLDPDTVGPFLRHVPAARTLFNVVSRSGTTPETAALYLTVRRVLEAELADGYRRHLVFTTDEERGDLRRIAEEEGIAALPYPRGVPGRFALFSAVGLLPSAILGIDVDGLLAGAREMRRRCESQELASNPAATLAAALFTAHARLGARIHVLMPYSDRLRELGAWYRQLWGSTLGKHGSETDVPEPPTPATAAGVVDHYAQFQLYSDGPADKAFVFLTVRQSLEDLEVPTDSGFRLPAGLHLGAMLRREATAAQDVLRGLGRPSLLIEVPALGPAEVGQLFMLWQLASIYAAGLYGVDPLGEPGGEAARRSIRERLAGRASDAR